MKRCPSERPAEKSATNFRATTGSKCSIAFLQIFHVDAKQPDTLALDIKNVAIYDVISALEIRLPVLVRVCENQTAIDVTAENIAFTFPEPRDRGRVADWQDNGGRDGPGKLQGRLRR